MKKVIKYLILFYLLLLFTLLISWTVWRAMMKDRESESQQKSFVVSFARFPHDVLQFIFKDRNAASREVLNTEFKDGFTYFTDTSSLVSGSLLISTFDQNSKSLLINLIDVKSGKKKRNWLIHSDSILKFVYDNTITYDNLRLWHPTLFKDNSIVFNTGSSLIKIDSVSKIVWVNKFKFHHGLEALGDSIIWACGTDYERKKFSFKNQPFVNDLLVKIDAKNGAIISKISILDIMLANGFEDQLVSGKLEEDMFHLNDIQIAINDSKYWKKNDLLVSINHRNTVFLFRPSENKLIWHQQGPWISQHDCDFLDNSKILVFGNDIIRYQYGDTLINNTNNAYVFDFETGKTETPYTKLFKNANIRTRTEGRCDILSNGDIFIDESNNGRIIIGDTTAVKMIYVSRINSSKIKMLNWVRFLPDLTL